ncbi:2-octaprenyl-6-methoxyphenyl hydroxylase [Neiella marina]|uniref:2-octaprenyl-6-methoxyphenyl hydroxylase n=1 Tax=Neiella holothuriorum TaxID=2870530 RepID=A0ABS7ELC0_9GAMM|nr:2-octaprenyl-6-methoxyphenyl hydroxylase [Neiella holothuriorum]MBW8192683.1 2-octaprenyl-6-methoxyphenyl hydroxylase [Neiella holothuriorum]
MSATTSPAAAKQPTDYDVIIAGGGLAGLSLAYALQQVLPWRIAVIEAKPLPTGAVPATPSSHYDERVLALSAMTVRILKALNLWSTLANKGYPIRHIHVSDEGNYGKVRLDAEQQSGATEFGQVLAARHLGEHLQHQAEQAALDWFRPAHIESTSVLADHREVKLNTGDTLRCQLLVVADGGESNTCDVLGIEAEEHDYQHVAVIANITTDKPHNGLAVERFTANGPLALLPMTEQRRSLVWTLPPERAAEVVKLSEQAFSEQLQQAMGYRHGLITQVGSRQSYPLKRRLVTHAGLPRAVIIGNAAHALHPIAGQGFNLALRDVMELAMQLNKRGVQADIGTPSVIQHYQQQRQGDQIKVANATHALATLFSNDLPPLKWARNLGLVAMSHVPPAQQWLVNQAMGVSALSEIVEGWSTGKSENAKGS